MAVNPSSSRQIIPVFDPINSGNSKNIRSICFLFTDSDFISDLNFPILPIMNATGVFVHALHLDWNDQTWTAESII
jgi:hypothetical protein